MTRDDDGWEGLLVDIGTGVLRQGRLLVQGGPGGIVFIGLGRRAAQLDGFAFGGGEDADPFFVRCRRIDDLINGDEFAKAAELGLPPALFAMEDRALRRLAIAEVLAKVGYDPDEPRVPAGTPEGGQWTGGDDHAEIGDGIVPIAAHAEDIPAKKQRFVDAHLADAQRAADELGVPVENILALSALESRWGEHRFAARGNNYFGIHAPAPFAIGKMPTEDGKTEMATFASYADSLKSFVKITGPIIKDTSDPAEFARALQDSGKFGINRDGSKVPTYVEETAKTIRGLRSFVARRRI